MSELDEVILHLEQLLISEADAVITRNELLKIFKDVQERLTDKDSGIHDCVEEY